MWSVVEFIDDESVEVVPAYWLNKHLCLAKNKFRKMAKLNVIDFDFLKARKLGKNRGMYFIYN